MFDLSPGPQASRHLSPFGIVGDNHASFAGRVEVLARVETEASDIAQTADTSTFVSCTNRLGGILDHDQTMTARHLEDRVHVGWLPVQMDRYDRFCSVRHSLFERRRIHGQGRRGDVDETDSCTDLKNCRDRADEREWHGNHLVARPDPACHERDNERARPGVHSDGVRRLAVACEFVLEGLDLGTQGVSAAAEHTDRSGLHRAPDTFILGSYIDERDHNVVDCTRTGFMPSSAFGRLGASARL